MTDNFIENREELIKELAKKYESVIEQRDDLDFQVNKRNWTKLLTVLDYLSIEAEKLGGKIEPVHIIPKEQHGYVEATFDVFDVYGESLKAFIQTLSLADSFSVESLIDGKIRIGVTINGVYQKSDR